ncbi:MAG: formylglycine-generating enzyme family protein [Phaeodactylibacter sp.]|uniref:formylglycine-generating enzyme family protein n=1 Tax=Phaeodactylibacter sp. TaxID=1940289 RepID=UPI0032EE62D0
MEVRIYLSFILITFSLALPAQKQAAESFLSDYFASLNNLGDAGSSFSDRQFFAVDINKYYFLPDDKSIVFNHLRKDGARYITAREYLDNLLIDFPKGVQFSFESLEVIDIHTSGEEIELAVFLELLSQPHGEPPFRHQLSFVILVEKLGTSRLSGLIKTIDSGKLSQNDASVESPSVLPGPIESILENMVFVEGGSFSMGCTQEQGKDCFDREKPVHKVRVSDFYISKYEVTQSQWEAVMGKDIQYYYENSGSGGGIVGKGPDFPMYYVDWEDANEFIRKLNKMTGKNFRLPYEAEWEFAAKGGNKSLRYKYSGSNSCEKVANSGSATTTVGSKAPNELGLYDMSGNIIEWCWDWYGPYSSSTAYNPKGPDFGEWKVLRGGGWGANSCVAARSSHRISNNPLDRNYFYGFRLVCEDCHGR